jgi:hypothetical protein
VTTTTAITAQAVETTWVCDECAGDGQLAYDLEASVWVPHSATADWPADDRIGISVLDCLQCDGTGTVRLDPGRGNRPTRSGR